MVYQKPIKALVVFLSLISLGQCQDFTPLGDWLFYKTDSSQTKNSVSNLYGGTPSIATDNGASLDSKINCNSLSLNSETFNLYADFNSKVSSLTEFTIAFWTKFESTKSSNVFQFGYTNAPHYVISSDVDGTLNVVFYKGYLTTPDHNNDFSFTVPLNKWFAIAFNFVNSGGSVTLNIFVSGAASYSKTNVGGSTSPFQLPGGLVLFGLSVKAKFYEAILTSTALISDDFKTITLKDSSAKTYSFSEPCSASCPDDACYSSKCVAYREFCTHCTGSSCDACDPDSGRDETGYCKSCKTGYALLGDNCNFYIGCVIENNCGTCSSKSTVCDSCAAGNFLYQESATSTSCIACSDSCTSCKPGPNCYECADSIVQNGSTCIVNKVGYEASFEYPNIVIDFANPLSTGLSKNSFKAISQSGATVSTTNWSFIGCTVGSKQCIIGTDNVTGADLPLSLDFEFTQA